MLERIRTARILQAAKARALMWVHEWFPSHALAGILVLGLLEGLACFIVVPPWWHYDEPGHFEYAWLVAHSPSWPTEGQYDQPMRRQMAESMLKYGWYEIRNFKLDLESNEPLPIGVTQVGDQPAYYFAASLPLRLMPNADMTAQYYAARAVSLLLFLLIVATIWYALGEILPDAHPLRWMSAVFVALLPAFADTMVSVNNDVSAVLGASLFLWASLRLIQRGYSIGRVSFLAASLVLCYLSKNTAWFVFALAPAALILAVFRGRFQLVVWGAGTAAVIVLALLTLQWGGPRAWYKGYAYDYPPRAERPEAPLGKYVFQFDDSGTGGSGQFVQFMPPGPVKSMRNQPATLGAWMWADQPTQAGPLFIRFWTANGNTIDSPWEPQAVTTEPVFYKATFDVPIDAVSAIVYLQHTGHSLPHNNLYVDGVTLASGEFSSNPPHFSAVDGAQGKWDGQSFNNLLRNGSAEEGSFQIRRWADDRTARFLGASGINASVILTTVQDWRGTGWYYRDAAGTIFRTFWASLAGDKAFLASRAVSVFLMVFTGVGLAGAVIWLWMRRRNLRWDVIGFLGLSLLAPLVLAFGRGISDIPTGEPILPWARYVYPAILPAALILCAGWLAWMELLPAALGLGTATKKAVFWSLMMGISAFAIMNAIQAFHPGWWYGWVSLGLLFLFQFAIFHFLMKWRAGWNSPPTG